MPMHPIADKAEISVEFPDKAYIGSFGRYSQFDAYAEADAVAIKLVRPGDDRREAMMHLHYELWPRSLPNLQDRSRRAIRSTNRTAPNSLPRRRTLRRPRAAPANRRTGRPPALSGRSVISAKPAA